MAQKSEAATSQTIVQPGERAVPDTRGALDRAQLKGTPGYYRRAWRRLMKDRLAMVALAVGVFILMFSFGAPVVSLITGHSYAQGDYSKILAPVGTPGFPLGTDANGRDILTRLAYGGRVSMMVSCLTVVFALTIGATVGSVAGYYGGLIDNILMRLVDVIISIPGITLLLLISVWWRPGPVGLAVVIASIGWTGVSRLIRGEVLSLKSRDYIDAARVSGASNARIIFRHIFPNVISIVTVWVSLALPAYILYEATISYLGFGVRIPIPSWGNMLNEAKDFYATSWTYVFFPGFAIYVASLAFNLLGNGLRDALDPRLNE